MSMNNQGRPTGTGPSGFASTSGSALIPNEPLLFEIGDTGHSGVDLPDAKIDGSRLGGFERQTPLDLAGLTEPEALRHYVRLSRMNYSIDSGMYPLGSCTMKHNPRLNEKMARLPGFGDIHPLQPVSTVPGALELMQQLAHWLLTLTNTTAVCLTPKAGAHGELCGTTIEPRSGAVSDRRLAGGCCPIGVGGDGRRTSVRASACAGRRPGADPYRGLPGTDREPSAGRSDSAHSRCLRDGQIQHRPSPDRCASPGSALGRGMDRPRQRAAFAG